METVLVVIILFGGGIMAAFAPARLAIPAIGLALILTLLGPVALRILESGVNREVVSEAVFRGFLLCIVLFVVDGFSAEPQKPPGV